ncbi:general transcription factor 3C polypeptide 1 [Diretmus argenteus]
MDALSIVEDEVALEGLDGITIPSLWIRLEDRNPKFPLKLDAQTKEFIWKSIISNTELKVYELPQERDDVVLFDRFTEIDPDTGIQTADKFSYTKDVYPVRIVEDKNGIQGSCFFYKERRDITKHVRPKALSEFLSLEEAFKRFGRKLVVVASQTLRFRAMIGAESDPDLKLSDHSYCILERLGRARWQGELQRDLHACSFKTDAGKLHYMRKSLVRHGLITTQSHVSRLPTGQQQYSILLLLKRFHIIRRSKYDILMESLSNILQETPGHLASIVALRDQLNVNERTFKRVHQYMQSAKLIQIINYPLEDLNPGNGPCTTKRGAKVLVRCLRLLKPYVKKEIIVEEEDDDEEDGTGARRKTLPSEGRVMERDLLLQAYHIVVSCGTRGISRTALGWRMNIGKLESRMICHKLERNGMIKGFMEDVGRQRTTKFISHKCVAVSDDMQQFAKEQERNKLLCSTASHKVAPRNSKTSPSTPKTPSTSRAKATQSTETPLVTEIQEEDGDGQEAEQMCSHGDPDMGDQGSDIPQVRPSKKSQSNHVERPHETYRLLKRKNMIVEAIRSLRIIEGLYTLQKMINDEEKLHGVSTKCCKKSILRLIRSLSREGMLKLYTTTVLQDGVSKKVEMVVHPSIQPNDEVVKRAIDQVRFRISSSHSVARLQQAEEKAKEQEQLMGETAGTSKAQKGKGDQQKTSSEEHEEFKPTSAIVKGLGRSFGFQPKMHRLRVIHNFLWHLIYGHPLLHSSTGTHTPSQSPTCTDPPCTDPPHTDTVENPEPSNPSHSGADNDAHDSQSTGGQTSSEKQNTAEATPSILEVTSSGDEEECVSSHPYSQSDLKGLQSLTNLLAFYRHLVVYVDEESWKRFVPPVPIHKEFGHGWALVSDLILCLPLSVFIQVIQINYEVEGLEAYLNDPVKQHCLVRALPSKMRRQLLYKRKYIFTFHDNLQKMVYMGLLQFGPVEKFQDKDQVFVYLKRNATIVDTTSSDPHYWQVTESPDKPFDRRHYTFTTAETVENYWFDLLCVCLNTPLGLIRGKRGTQGEEPPPPPILPERSYFLGLADLLRGSREVCDDGVVPGDGKGAGGLDSEFFAHLKRNWLWTNHLLFVKKNPSGGETSKARLKTPLSKNALRMALKAGGLTSPLYVTTKRPMIREETVEVAIEPASRNQQVVGGKRQKRKKCKKEIVKIPRRKKKELKKRGPAHDEADHRALKRMTRQRVTWSIPEDSLMMLCSVASHLLNSKIKRPFVPYCVVRDLLQAEFEKSMDKTSLAVGRRTRYILKNPQTLLNYRICLAEVYQDSSLMKVLEKKKPTDPENPEDCAESFSEYTRLLRQKFSSTVTSCDVVIPNTTHQLFSRFKVYMLEDGKEMSFKDTLNCAEDIHAIVLYNLIQSTLVMTHSQMKSSRSFQTFHMYSKYSQELLCQVFIQCRKRGLVNRRRFSKSYGPKKNRALPILPMSYQLSQTYYRCFAWRFPFTLCTDVFRFMRTLTDNRTLGNRPLTTFYHETQDRTYEKEEPMEIGVGSAEGSQTEKKEDGEAKQMKEHSCEGKKDDRLTGEPGGQTEKANDILTKEGENNQSKDKGEQKEIDTNNEKEEGMSKNEVQNQRANPDDSFTLNTTEEPSTGEQAEDPVPQEEQQRVEPASDPAPPASEESPDLSDMSRFSIMSPGGAAVACLSLMTLGLVSVHVSIPKQVVVVDSNLVDNEVVKSMAALEEEDEDDDEGEECEGRKRLEVKAHQASHTNYLMMRGYCVPGIVKLRNLGTNDSIVVESCIMSFQLRSTPAHQLFIVEDTPPLDFFKCGPSLLPSFLSHTVRLPSSSLSPSWVEECDGRLICQRGYSTQDITACAELRRSLDEAGTNGLDSHDLHQAHRHLAEPHSGRTRSLQQYMQELQAEGQLLQVGALGVRWVLMPHAGPWLLTTLRHSKPGSQSRLSQDVLLPLWENQHNIPFMRKRCRDVQDEGEETPRKKLAEDTGRDEEGAGGSKVTSEEPNNGELEEQRAVKEENSEGRLFTSEEEEGKQTLPEEEEEEEEEAAVQEKDEIKDKSDKPDDGEQRDKEERMEPERDGRLPPVGPPDTDDEELSFISRPWRMVDGKVNLPACKGMLEGLLYHIMSRPGLTQHTLVEHYRKVLHPVVVLDLTQALIEMGCVKKRSLVRNRKPSLFSCPVGQTGGEAGVRTEEPDTVFYEPTISCCLRLAQVLPNEPHWNQFI